MKNNISKGIQLLRKKKNLSQAGLGIALGVSRAKISNWEIGRRKISLEEAIQIARYFKVSLDELVNPETLEEEE